jgi:hypothetical protein
LSFGLPRRSAPRNDKVLKKIQKTGRMLGYLTGFYVEEGWPKTTVRLRVLLHVLSGDE